jgi:hypothetical protein
VTLLSTIHRRGSLLMSVATETLAVKLSPTTTPTGYLAGETRAAWELAPNAFKALGGIQVLSDKAAEKANVPRRQGLYYFGGKPLALGPETFLLAALPHEAGSSLPASYPQGALHVAQSGFAVGEYILIGQHAYKVTGFNAGTGVVTLSWGLVQAVPAKTPTRKLHVFRVVSAKNHRFHTSAILELRT